LDDEIFARALRATRKIARHAGAGAAEPVVLYRSRRVCFLLPESATVVRLAPADEKNLAAEARELSVSRHLYDKGAPVVGPSPLQPAEPLVEDGMVATLWPNIVHTEADDDDTAALARAAEALHRVHQAFADYPGPLPSYFDRIAECGALLRDAKALPALGAKDRALLTERFDRLTSELAALDVPAQPIHGDAHLGNAFITPGGPLWMDFETASLGPREWDAASVMYPPAFPSLDPKLFDVLEDLRRVCVAVWCSALNADPDKRAAAKEQIAALKKDGSDARGA
jgi:aminoglycoside phosphotransferase (APT) family kinase protein